MNNKQIIFSDDARLKLKKGVDIVANTVKSTLGPKGRNVIIEKEYGNPLTTKDGVSVAKEIKLEDKFENMGADIIKEAATKMNEKVGDGTTSISVLVQSIFNEGLKLLAAGINPIDIRISLEKRTKEIVEKLKTMSKSISENDIENIASISANDKEIGKIIADTMKEVGKDGVITLEEGQSFGVEREMVKGMKLDKGYISSYFITDTQSMKAEISDPFIIITDKKLSNIQEVLPLLEKIMQSGKRDLVIIAEDVEGEALSTFVINKMKGVMNILCVKMPGFGNNKKEMMKDLAILTGGTVISDEVGINFENATLDYLGKATKVISTKDDTIIVGGLGNKDEIESRKEQIKKEIEESESKFDKENLTNRLAKLSGGIAVIKVGAATETEMKEKKDRIEDALNATRAAVEEGVLPGGGIALIIAGDIFSNKEINHNDYGSIILNKALVEPIKIIANNAGVDGSMVLFEVKKLNTEKDNFNYIGYDAMNNKYVAMSEAGILDPTKVVRSSLENAVSAAIMLLSTEAAISIIPTKKNDNIDSM